MLSSDEIFMREALAQARLAFECDEVPVGAVITWRDQIIAKAYNQVELLKDPTAHAEMIAITQASNARQHKWLADCCLYVTIEPCSMCAGAIVLSRLGRICYGAVDPKTGACGSIVNLVQHPKLNHRVEITSGIYAALCGELLTDFFKDKRRCETKKILD